MNRRPIFFICGAILAMVTLFSFAPNALGLHTLPSGIATNVLGWLWGGTTDETLGSAPTLNTTTGLGWVNLHSEGESGAASYGLRIPGSGEANQAVQGYAWSSNVGWLNFQPSGPFPAAPNFAVKRVANHLEGWARFESIKQALATPVAAGGASAPNNSGNWEGWVKFSLSYVGSINGVNYQGVQIVGSPPNQDIRGYAWSNEFGWIQWGGLTGSLDPNPKALFPPVDITCTLQANPSAGTVPPPLSGNLTWNITSSQQSYTSCTVTGPNLGAGPVPTNFSQIGSISYSNLSNSATYTLSCTNENAQPSGIGSCSADVTVANLPVVTVQAIDTSASEEGQDPGKYRLSRTGNTASELTVQFSMNGSASPSDYTLSPPTVAIPASVTFTDIVLTPVDDVLVESNENATLTISEGSEYVIGTPSSATVTIQDNDTPAQLNCVPSSQAVSVNENASFSAQNGSAPYSWNASGGNPESGAGSLFQTAYGTAGSRTVTVSDNAGASDTCAVNVTSGGPPAVSLTPVSCFPSVQQSPPNVFVGFEASGGELLQPTSCPAGANCAPLYQWSAPDGSVNSCAGANPNTQQPAVCFGPNFSTKYPPPPGSHTVTVTNVRPQLENFTAMEQSDTCQVVVQIEVPP